MSLLDAQRAAHALAAAMDAAVAAEAQALIRQLADEPDTTGIPPWSEVGHGGEDPPAD
jgi:hypothetical protein